MKTIIVASTLSILLCLVSCSKDEKSTRGILEVRYGTPYLDNALNPVTLYIYSTDNTETYVQYITTANREKAKVDLLAGTYLLKEESGKLNLTIQIWPDRSTKVYFSPDILTLD